MNSFTSISSFVAWTIILLMTPSVFNLIPSSTPIYAHVPKTGRSKNALTLLWIVFEKIAEVWLNTWISEMHQLAKEHTNDTKCYREATENFHCMTKHESAEDANRAAKCPTLSGPSCVANNVSSSQNASQSSTHTCPKLMENKRLLLDKHQRCTKCCCGYQNHHAGNCPNGFPDPSGSGVN
jgi:hypothetical protein